MTGLLALALLALVYVLLEHGCAATPASRRMSWFDLVAAEQLVVSKKARTRGDVDGRGLSRRERAHS